MTPQEAIVILNRLCQEITDLSTLEALTMGIKSLEKQIPKKPVVVGEDYIVEKDE